MGFIHIKLYTFFDVDIQQHKKKLITNFNVIFFRVNALTFDLKQTLQTYIKKYIYAADEHT